MESSSSHSKGKEVVRSVHVTRPTPSVFSDRYWDYSTNTWPTKTFAPFLLLPAEIRRKVWRAAIPGRLLIVNLFVRQYTGDGVRDSLPDWPHDFAPMVPVLTAGLQPMEESRALWDVARSCREAYDEIIGFELRARLPLWRPAERRFVEMPVYPDRDLVLIDEVDEKLLECFQPEPNGDEFMSDVAMPPRLLFDHRSLLPPPYFRPLPRLPKIGMRLQYCICADTRGQWTVDGLPWLVASLFHANDLLVVHPSVRSLDPRENRFWSLSAKDAYSDSAGKLATLSAWYQVLQEAGEWEGEVPDDVRKQNMFTVVKLGKEEVYKEAGKLRWGWLAPKEPELETMSFRGDIFSYWVKEG